MIFEREGIRCAIVGTTLSYRGSRGDLFTIGEEFSITDETGPHAFQVLSIKKSPYTDGTTNVELKAL